MTTEITSVMNPMRALLYAEEIERAAKQTVRTGFKNTVGRIDGNTRFIIEILDDTNVTQFQTPKEKK